MILSVGICHRMRGEDNDACLSGGVDPQHAFAVPEYSGATSHENQKSVQKILCLMSANVIWEQNERVNDVGASYDRSIF